MTKIKVFGYVESLDAFVLRDEFRGITHKLKIAPPIDWIGQLFEQRTQGRQQWLQNWEALEARGLDHTEALVLDERLLAEDKDYALTQHPPQLRKQFWTDVLGSLELSLEVLFEKARLEAQAEYEHQLSTGHMGVNPLEEVEQQIAVLRARYGLQTDA